MEQVAAGAGIAAAAAAALQVVAEGTVEVGTKDGVADGLGGIAPEGIARVAAVDSHRQHSAGWRLSVPWFATWGYRDPLSLLVSRTVFAGMVVSAVALAVEAAALADSLSHFLNCLTSEACTVKLSDQESHSAHSDIGAILAWDPVTLGVAEAEVEATDIFLEQAVVAAPILVLFQA